MRSDVALPHWKPGFEWKNLSPLDTHGCLLDMMGTVVGAMSCSRLQVLFAALGCVGAAKSKGSEQQALLLFDHPQSVGLVYQGLWLMRYPAAEWPERLERLSQFATHGGGPSPATFIRHMTR